MVEREVLMFPITDKDLKGETMQRLKDTIERHFNMEIRHLKIIIPVELRRGDITLK